MKPSPCVEWLETNGLGGYAFGTADGTPTRRYHGLLISARRPPVERRTLFGHVVLSQIADGRETALDPAPGDTAGADHIIDFSRELFPTWTYRCGSGKPDRLTKILFMRHGHNTTVIRFRLDRGARPIWLSIRILPSFKEHNDINGQSRADALCVDATQPDARTIRFASDGDAGYLFHSLGDFIADSRKIGPVPYVRETRQGMEDREWFHSPGRIELSLAGGQGFDVVLSDRPVRQPNVDAWQRAEESCRRNLAAHDRGCVLPLTSAADQFLVSRTVAGRKLRTIVAGYPWFTDWGRDTMISLEGLTLVRGEYDAAEEILAAFANAESEGMIPNHYPEADTEPHFNTVDASLLFFEAGWKFLAYSGREAFVRKVLYPRFESILRHHLRGTRFNIHADPKTGFLFSGEKGTQLTWMDAKVDDWVVTPRHGYPVEIQALWYNALKIFETLSARFRENETLAEDAGRMADLCRRNFTAVYWCAERGHLHDCLTPDWRSVPDLRPNQLMALSLSHRVLTDNARGRAVLRAVRTHLLTPVGLRTLTPDHPDYKGRHEGDRLTRDVAYHQGTIWPWLLGPYARAYQAVYGRNAKSRAHLRAILRGIRPHLTDCVVGTISEIMDGDPPHDPKGCVAQAWSVAELNVINHLVG